MVLARARPYALHNRSVPQPDSALWSGAALFPLGGGGGRSALRPLGGVWSRSGCKCRLVRVTMAEGDSLISVDYEVFGRVQGVFFRKYTQNEGKKLGVVGWVQNTEDGTVQGQIQGPTVKVREMQEWLRKKGSPRSHIDRTEFRNEKKIFALEHKNFSIVK